MIQCEWGWVGVQPIKRCPSEACYVLKFEDSHPIAMPFNDYNFVCQKHLDFIKKKMKSKPVIYEITKYEEGVQFT